MRLLHLTTLLCLAIVLVQAAALADGTAFLDPAAEQRLALAAEKAQDWPTALTHWENLIDSCEIDTFTRYAAVERVRQIRPKVPVDPATQLANTWTCLVLVYENVDFTWTDKDGKAQTIKTTMSQSDIDTVRQGFDNYARNVLDYTSREMAIKYDFRVVKRPLTALIGEGTFWLDPAQVAQQDMKDDARDHYDSVFAFTKYQQEKGSPSIPAPFAAGALGGDAGPKGAGYTHVILWADSLVPGTRDGEIELHEWLHQVDWMFTAVQGYPDDIMPTSDGGRKEGDFGGDPDFRRQPEDPSWDAFYQHIMKDHATRAMWRIASMHRVAPSPWTSTNITEWLVLGPFEKTEGKTFDTPFIDEKTIAPKTKLFYQGKEWRILRTQGTVLNLDDFFSPNENVVAYAHIYVHSAEAQTAQLRLGSDDGCAVWRDGALIYNCVVARGTQRDSNIIDVNLAKGWTRFLFKVDEISGGWSLTARFTDAQGQSLKGVRTAVEPEAPAEPE